MILDLTYVKYKITNLQTIWTIAFRAMTGKNIILTSYLQTQQVQATDSYDNLE